MSGARPGERTVGTVAALWRYPVKSMLGEGVTATEATERGLRHDRALALLHRETGRVASAKHPRVWRRMLTLRAALVGSAVRIDLPDGRSLWSTDPDADAVLSAELEQPVTLTGTPPAGATLDRAKPDEVLAGGVSAPVAVDVSRVGTGAPAGTFFDFAPLHLLTTATLDRVAGSHPDGTADQRRYRPNVVIRTDDAPDFVENAWAGRTLRVGSDLTLRVLLPTPRCAVPTLAHGRLPRDPDVLRVLAAHNRVVPLPALGPQPCAGVYARVLRPGPIRVGDRVTVLPD